ncbi:MAG: hypothetical protein HDS61_02145 [Barnesiella sp.]|nr:hypothetical protein [Barnesiella sp.]
MAPDGVVCIKKKAGAMPSPALQSVAFEPASITGTSNFDSTLLYADTKTRSGLHAEMSNM